MRKTNVFYACFIALFAMFAVISCGTGASKDKVRENVYTKKAAAYKAAAEKLGTAVDAAALNEINAQLEKEIATISTECEAEYEKIFEEKKVDIDAYRADEDSLKAAQKRYDDLYIDKFMNFKNL